MYVSTASAPSSTSETSGQSFSNEPVCYGPDGQILTEEESSFLADNEAEYDDIIVLVIFIKFNFNHIISHRYPNDIFDELDPDMDLEIKMAFKDFVRGYPQN